jgi:hypothetical protein
MPTPLSVKERIEIRLQQIAADIAGVTAAERWDARGNTTAPGSVVIVPGDEVAEEGGLENSGTTENRFTVEAHALVAPKPGDAQATATAVNHWLAVMVKAFLADPLLIEPDTAERLAIDTRQIATVAAPARPGQPEVYAILVLEVLYAHRRDDPYTAPWITLKEV